MKPRKMATVKAWAVVSREHGVLKSAVNGFYFIMPKKKDAESWARHTDSEIVRVSISELPPKRKGKR